MFDVIWTDPGLEKVGERKARKEQEHEQEFKDGQDRHSKRGSVSTRRSSSSAGKSTTTKSTGEKAAGLFGNFSLKKKRLSSKSKISHASDLRIPIPEVNTVTLALPTASTFCSTFSSTDFLLEPSPNPESHSDAKSPLDPQDTAWWEQARESSPIISHGDARLSRNQHTAPNSQCHSPTGAFDSASQSMPKTGQGSGPGSWISKVTETSIEVSPETGPNCVRSEFNFLGKRVPADPHTPSPLLPLDRNLTRISSRHYGMNEPSPLARFGTKSPTRAHGTIRSRKSPRTTAFKPKPQEDLLKFKVHDSARWKSQDEWDVEDRVRVEVKKGFDLEEHFRAVTRPSNDSLADLASVQREIKKMALLAPASILFRLEEQLTDFPNPSAYKEAELEKKRLMLFALGAFGGPCESARPTRATRILALFEAEATASYLAAIRPASSITHLSPSPLSPILFPNVRPLVSPVLSNSALSLVPNSFSAAYCLSLPSILSSRDIPSLLGNVHKCLLPRGVFHLVLIDPAPEESSLGPHMRRWMEEHLLLALERQFRCTNPRNLIIKWLREAGLRVDNNTVTTIRSQAACAKPDDKGRSGDTTDPLNGDVFDREEQTRLALQSKIGRMLWQEAWGSYVHANKWWWDVRDCAEECAQLGTYWDYSIVKAVKDS